MDEITAAHVVACDLIVHFGHCCYSAPSIYPTLIIPSYHTMVSGSSKLDDDSVRKKKCAEFLVNKSKLIRIDVFFVKLFMKMGAVVMLREIVPHF